MFKNIIVAIDGSDISFTALDRAITIAKQNQAKLHSVCVVDSHAIVSTPMDSTGDIQHRRLEKEANETIEKIKAAVAEKGYEVETHLEGGHPGDVIVNLAEKLDCDLIIAGSLGKSAFDRLFLGSVSSYISKATKTNFLIVRN